MLAAYVLDPSKSSFSLDSLAREYLGHETIRYKDVVGVGKNQIRFDEVPIENATPYAAEDADVALKLCDLLVPQIDDSDLKNIVSNLAKKDKIVLYALIFSIFLSVVIMVTRFLDLPEGHGFMFLALCFIVLGFFALWVIFKDIIQWVISFIKR